MSEEKFVSLIITVISAESEENENYFSIISLSACLRKMSVKFGRVRFVK